MDIIKIVMIGIICVVLVVMLKSIRPEYALLVEIIGGVIIFFLILTKISSIYGLLQDLSQKIKFDSLYFKILMKVVGISYIAEFGISICKDAGQSAIASKIELGAKILILIVALPVLNVLLEKIAQILR